MPIAVRTAEIIQMYKRKHPILFDKWDLSHDKFTKKPTQLDGAVSVFCIIRAFCNFVKPLLVLFPRIILLLLILHLIPIPAVLILVLILLVLELILLPVLILILLILELALLPVLILLLILILLCILILT